MYERVVSLPVRMRSARVNQGLQMRGNQTCAGLKQASRVERLPRRRTSSWDHKIGSVRLGNCQSRPAALAVGPDVAAAILGAKSRKPDVKFPNKVLELSWMLSYW